MNSPDRETLKRLKSDLEFRRDRAWGSQDRGYYVKCIIALDNVLREPEPTPVDDHFASGCGGCCG